MTVKDVASFMLNEIKKNGSLPQVGLVDIIKEKFGNEFVLKRHIKRLLLIEKS